MSEDEDQLPEADGAAEPGEEATNAEETALAETADETALAESGGDSVDLAEFDTATTPAEDDPDQVFDEAVQGAQDLEPVYDVTVNVQAVLGKSSLEVSQLLKLGPGAVIELDRKVGEAIDIYVNNRLVARGEVVLVENHLGVTMTEIIKGDRI